MKFFHICTTATRRLSHRGKHMFLMRMLLVTVCLCSSRGTDVDIYGLRNIVRRTERTVEQRMKGFYIVSWTTLYRLTELTIRAWVHRNGQPCPGSARHRDARTVSSSSSLVLAVCKPTGWISPPMVLDRVHTQVMHRHGYMHTVCVHI